MRGRLPKLTDNLCLYIVCLSLYGQLMFAFAGVWLSSYLMTFVLSLWCVYALIAPAFETTEDDLFAELEALEAELEIDVYWLDERP